MKRIIACCLAIVCSFFTYTNSYASPGWVLNPPSYEGYIIGVGVGDDRLEAKNAALSEIVSQLSVDFSVEQIQVLSTENAVAKVRFKQSSQMSTIPFSLEGIEMLESSQFHGKTAVLMGIKNNTLIISLQNKLAILFRLSPVKNNPSKQFLWALSYGNDIDLASRRIRVLKMLGEDTSVYDEVLTSLLNERRKALDAVALKVIASHELAPLKSAMKKSIPQTGDTLLWLKVNLKWKYNKRSAKPKVQASLSFAITESQSPFKELHQHTLVSQATASSVKAAKEKVMQQLKSQVETPISHWMFDNH